MSVFKRREWEHLSKLRQKGGATQGKVWLGPQSSPGTFTEPTSAHLVQGISFDGDPQSPVMLEREVRDFSTRNSPDKISGPIDHVERKLVMELLPPGQLTGADNLTGAAVLANLCGDSSQVFPGAVAQAEVTIVALVSQSDTKTVLTLDGGAATDFPLGSIWGFRSKIAGTAFFDNQPAAVTAVVANGGDWDVTFEPAFLGRPTAADKMQPGVSWIPQKLMDNVMSYVSEQGFNAEMARDAVAASGSVTIDKRSLFKIELAIQAVQTYMSSLGFVHGAGGTDDFTSAELTLDVLTARPYQPGALVNLNKITIADGTVATETKAEIASVDTASSPNTVTLKTRGSTPISTAAGNMTAVTTAANEKAFAAATTVAGDFLRIELDYRGYIDVPLTVKVASYEHADLVLDYHAALKTAAKYGRLNDVPLVAADYSTGVASAQVSGVRLQGKAKGSQAQVKAIKTGLAGDRFTLVWDDPDTFEILATYEIQINPWTPGGTNTRTPVKAWEGLACFLGKSAKWAQCAANIDNGITQDEATRNGTPYGEGHIEDWQQKVELSITGQPWTGHLDALVDFMRRDEAVAFAAWVGAGVGKTVSIIVLRGKVTKAPTKSGDNAVEGAYTIMATDPSLGGYDDTIPQFMIGLT